MFIVRTNQFNSVFYSYPYSTEKKTPNIYVFVKQKSSSCLIPERLFHKYPPNPGQWIRIGSKNF